ncbi:acid protease [Phanerochaete sordida]|uniref:Acid protease n=1 Tax=Phanerochaete sordida TaxID=48140 RepID=A0A9P3GDY9_9APHY|nr:acid protease [Phanerochaete sordida]
MALFVNRSLAGFLVLGLQLCLVASRNVARDSGAGVPFAGIVVSDTQDGDYEYTVNITLGGQDFTVQLDSGSSDLWVYAPNGGIQITNDSHISGGIEYVKGVVSGTIQFAELKFGEYTIPSQAFLNVQNISGVPPGTVGILGVSFDSNNESLITHGIHKNWGEDVTLGRTVLSNIFAQNASLQPSYDLALNRWDDLDEDGTTGELVIGYHDPQYADIAQAPQIPRVIDNQWAGYLDGMKVNGENVPLTQSSYNTTDGQLIVLFDSGTSDMIIPGPLVDAVYSQIAGSVKVNGTWVAPCYNSANVSLTIGGLDYPLHPLDLSRTSEQTSALQDGTEETFLLCVASFTDASTLTLNDVDIILGDVFLKNVVTSFNFGPENREGDHPGASGSFVQLLSLTDPDEAWLDFQLTRSFLLTQPASAPVIDPVFLPTLFPADFGAVQNYTNTGAITPFPSAVSSAPSSSPTAAGIAGTLEDAAAPSAGAESDGGVVSLLDKYGPVVIGLLGANLAVMVLLCVVALAACTRGAMRSGARMRNISPSYAPVSFREKPAAGFDPEEHAPIRSYGEQ